MTHITAQRALVDTGAPYGILLGSRTLIGLFDERVAASGDTIALRGRQGRDWNALTWTEWHRASLKLAAGLIALGVGNGERVAILSRTRTEWVLADMAILMCGAVNVPLYDAILPRQAGLILAHCDATVALVEDPAQLEKLLAVRDQLPNLKRIVFFDEVAALETPDRLGRTVIRLEDIRGWQPEDDWVIGLGRLRELGSGAIARNPNVVLDRIRTVRPEDTASIVYTAGTTGRPRGVMLSHGAIRAAVEAWALSLPASDSDTQLVFLPLGHAFGRITYLTGMRTGAVTALVPGTARLTDDLRDVRPTILVGVPRVFERAHARIVDEATRQGRAAHKAMVRALELAEAWSRARAAGTQLAWYMEAQRLLAERTVFRRLRELFGGNLRFAISGGAPLAPELAHTLHGAGLLVLEGYGLTESCATLTANRPDRFRFGSVGVPLPGVEVRIGHDGEVLTKGPTVMSGYWDDPEGTRSAFEDGWLRTGDIGELDDGWLRVTGRKKDMIVTASGRAIPPAPIEAAIRACPFIEQAVLSGDSRPYLTALVTLHADAIRSWASGNGLAGLDDASLVRHARVFQLVRDAVDEVNRDLPPHEQVRRFAILDEPFGQESGEVTASGSARRRFIAEKYRGVLDALYSGAG